MKAIMIFLVVGSALGLLVYTKVRKVKESRGEGKKSVESIRKKTGKAVTGAVALKKP